MNGRRLEFGKYRGSLLRDVPLGYLQWCLPENDFVRGDPGLRHDIEAELSRRGGTPQTEEAGPLVQGAAVVRQWYREMVLRWHPDRGGNNDAMQAINDAHDRLRQLLGL